MSDAVYRVQPLTHPAANPGFRVPGSKSITNRALLLAALAEGESTIDRALFSDDTRYMAAALAHLGVAVETRPVDSCGGETFHVRGAGGRIPVQEATLETGNAGTAARFLVAYACLGRGRFVVDGSERMRQRPIEDLLDALRQLGACVTAPTGCPPVSIDASGLRGGTARVKGERSSQYLSALLMVAPYAECDVEIEVVGELIAKPYIDLTLGVMEQFGVTVQRDDYRHFHVRHGQCYRAQPHYLVEPDASSAHYFLAAAALSGMRAHIEGLTTASLQGDARFVDVLERMGATVCRHPHVLEVHGPPQLRGVDVDLNAISDTAATLAVLATFAATPTRIRNVAHIRHQESDRIRNVTTELRKLGAQITEHADGWTIEPSRLHGGAVEPYEDHRLAMAFALIGLRVPGIEIRNPECVRKTFPDFFVQLDGLRERR